MKGLLVTLTPKGAFDHLEDLGAAYVAGYLNHNGVNADFYNCMMNYLMLLVVRTAGLILYSLPYIMSQRKRYMRHARSYGKMRQTRRLLWGS